MRKPIIAGNWKMNMTPEEGMKLINALIPKAKDAKCDVVCCVPYVDLPFAIAAAKGSNIKIGAQNMHQLAKGAYTGEISGEMLKAMGVTHVIIGHSERRQYFNETDENVNLKARHAIELGLTPIICVGETLVQRDGGDTDTVVSNQTKIALRGLNVEQLKQVVIAYEPIWAIGTGKTATNEQANETIGVIREAVRHYFGEAGSGNIRIQYGGSMNAANCVGLMAQQQIDGGLIGGASLKADDFATIVQAATDAAMKEIIK